VRTENRCRQRSTPSLCDRERFGCIAIGDQCCDWPKHLKLIRQLGVSCRCDLEQSRTDECPLFDVTVNNLQWNWLIYDFGHRRQPTNTLFNTEALRHVHYRTHCDGRVDWIADLDLPQLSANCR